MDLIKNIKFSDVLRNGSNALQPIKGLRNIAGYIADKDARKSLNYPLLVEHATKKYGNRVAIKYQDQQITYREFNQRANQVAHFLSRQGLGEGDVIALFMENRPEYLIYMTAISKIGAVAALINNSQRHKVLIHSLTLVDAKAIVVGEEVAEALQEVWQDLTQAYPAFLVPDTDAKWSNSNVMPICNIHEESSDYPNYNLAVTSRISNEAPCLYIYTSGTTGLPKASIQKHRKIGVITLGLGMLLSSVRKEDTVYNCLPLYHATGLFFSWFAVIANGASIAIRKRFSASEFWSDINKHNATIFVYIGELCRYLLNQPQRPEERQHKLRLATGNGLRPDLWDEFKSRFQIKEIREFYGSSEGNVVCYNLFNQRQTMGMALGAYAIVKVDTETELPIRDNNGHLIKTEVGEPGLLLGKITKATPFEGYTDQSKNESKIIQNAFDDGDAWFNSGDIVKNLGFRHLQFVDRTGDTYRWKGENVSTGEVEMFVNQFPGVEEAIAYGVEIPNTNGRAGMVAIREQESGVDYKNLYQFLKNELPQYAIPVFVRTLSSIDATGTFKYQRTSLKKEAFKQPEFDNKNDKVYVLLPGSNSYEPVDEEILGKIEESQYKF